MCEAVGHRVRRLERVGFGPLGSASWRAGVAAADPEEIRALTAAGVSDEQRAGCDGGRRSAAGRLRRPLALSAGAAARRRRSGSSSERARPGGA